jgi:hypothetical protein
VTQSSAPSFDIVRAGVAGLTLFAPFTRRWCVDRFFAALGSSDVPFAEASFVAYIDSNETDLAEAVADAALALPFAEVAVYFSGRETPAEFANVARRTRHGLVRTASVALVPKTGRLLLLEDDTLVPADVYARLSAALEQGYEWVCGFEVGRWGGNYCAGVWRFESRRGRLVAMTPMPGRGVEPVDATGLYCTLTTCEVYRSVSWGLWDDALGHDVTITRGMSLAGRRLAVDWGCRCIHVTKDGDLTCDRVNTFEHANPSFGLRYVLGGVPEPLEGPIEDRISPARPDGHARVTPDGFPADDTGVGYRIEVTNTTPHILVRAQKVFQPGETTTVDVTKTGVREIRARAGLVVRPISWAARQLLTPRADDIA